MSTATSQLNRSLTVTDLLIYGMIFMVPIAPFGVFGSTYDATHGMVAMTYLIGMVAMIFTAIGYWQMSRAFPSAGSIYTYASRSLHETVGFFAGWLILLDYILIPALLYIVSAAALGALYPSCPSWVWIVAFVAINTGINYFGIEFTAKANRYILVAELVILAIFLALGAYALHNNTPPTGFNIKPLYDAEHFSPSLVVSAVSIAALSFLGFDGISTLAEECKDGVDSVGKASIVALLVVGTLFIAQTWIAANLSEGLTFANLDTAFYEAARVAGGEPLYKATLWATILSWGIANALVAQAAVARILYSMGRDKVLPTAFAKLHVKYKTPYVSTFVVAGISLIAGIYFDGQIANLSRLVNFGALTGFVLLNLSVMRHYLLRQGSKRWFLHGVCPALGVLIIGYVLFSMETEAKQLGLGWLLLGAVYFGVLRLMGREFKPAI